MMSMMSMSMSGARPLWAMVHPRTKNPVAPTGNSGAIVWSTCCTGSILAPLWRLELATWSSVRPHTHNLQDSILLRKWWTPCMTGNKFWYEAAREYIVGGCWIRSCTIPTRLVAGVLLIGYGSPLLYNLHVKICWLWMFPLEYKIGSSPNQSFIALFGS